MSRKAVLMLTAMSAALVMASGVTLVAAIERTPGGDFPSGPGAHNQIYGSSRFDQIPPRGGNDEGAPPTRSKDRRWPA